MLALGIVLAVLILPCALYVMLGGKHLVIGVVVTLALMVGASVLISQSIAEHCYDKGGVAMDRGICFGPDGRRVS